MKEPASSPSPTSGEPLNHQSVVGAKPRHSLGKWLGMLVLCLLIAAAITWRIRARSAGHDSKAPGFARGEIPPTSVLEGVAVVKQVPIYLEGLGTVQAYNTVTVRSRVDGQVQHIAFVEGQDVRVGDLLAQIDPAPFQAQLDQNKAKKTQDEAQLAVARMTLKRDRELLDSKILSQQDFDTQDALVKQTVAAVEADQAAIDSIQIQLGYTKITSPLDGRTGMRLVDQGNLVHANDTAGLVVITQLRPIAVVFTLPEQNLRQIQAHLSPNPDRPLKAYALDRDGQTPLGEGTLAVIDNAIDTATGTIRLKATFSNTDLKLWPGQFVNVRLLLEQRDGVVVPASVVQRGPDGTFAFTISADQTAQVKPIKVAQIQQGQALIEEGLNPGDRVVVDGQYKLQPGAKVKPSDGEATGSESDGKGAVTEGGKRGKKAPVAGRQEQPGP